MTAFHTQTSSLSVSPNTILSLNIPFSGTERPRIGVDFYLMYLDKLIDPDSIKEVPFIAVIWSRFGKIWPRTDIQKLFRSCPCC